MEGSKRTVVVKVMEHLNNWERYSTKVTFRSNRVIVKSGLISELDTNKFSLPVSQRILKGALWEPGPLPEGIVPVHDIIEETEVEISNTSSANSSEDDQSSRSSIQSNIHCEMIESRKSER